MAKRPRPAKRKPTARSKPAAKPKAKPTKAAKPKPKPTKAAKPKPKPTKPAGKPRAQRVGELSEALRQAFAIAANEVLFESLEMIADDAVTFLADGSLGATYQSFIGPDTLPEAQLASWLEQLAAWAPATADPVWRRVGVALEQASLAVARAVIYEATGAGHVPDEIAVHAPRFQPLTRALKQAIEDGSFEEAALERIVPT